MASSSYVPNESYNTIVQEETWFQGTLLSNFFFGIQTTLCILSFVAVFQRRTPNRNRARIAFLVYISLLFALTTAAQGLLLAWIQMGFITQRNYPGGPSAFLNDEWSIPFNLASNILVVCANWMMESLLVWRCYVVCSAGKRLWWLGVAIPLLLLVAVFVTGGLFIHNVLQTTPPLVYVLAYSISSLALNLTATGFIAGRLLLYRHRIVSQLGLRHGQHYVSIVAVVVESAAMYTGFLLIVITVYVLGSPGANILQQVIEQVQTIASLLIIWRVARGEAWTRSDDTEVSVETSSSNTPPGPRSELNMIQLDVTLTRLDEGSIRRKEGEVSFLKNDAV